MKRITFIVSIVLLTGCTLLKGKNKINLESDFNVAQTYSSTIKSSDLEKHLTILASDEYEGRETAMAGQKKAAKYIEKHFVKNGLMPGLGSEGYQQSFPVALKNPSNIIVSINGNKLEFLKEFYYLGTINDTLLKDKKIVYLGYGIDQEGPGLSDYNGIDVTGKIVLIKEGIPKERDDIDFSWANWRKKVEAATKHGAIAVFTIQDDFISKVEQVKDFIENPRMQLHNKGRKQSIKIPNIYISKRAVDTYIDIEQQMSSFLKQKATIDAKTMQILASENVLGYIEGSDLKEELVIITAHYDHLGYDNGEVCNGADDDGSGTVALLELAQAFSLAKKEGNGPRRSMLFMTVSGEEKGLLGSQYYSENPVYPLANSVVDLNIDMIGRKDTMHGNEDYVYLIGADRISMDLHNISDKVNSIYVNMDLDYTYNQPNDPNHFYYRSDHYNFAKNGIPVIFYFSGVHEDYHKPTDDVEKINFSKLEKTTKLVFFTAWEIANRTERLRSNGKG